MLVLSGNIRLLATALHRAAFLGVFTLFVSTAAFAQTVEGLTLNPSTVISGKNADATVTLSSVAPSGGYLVNISTSSPTYSAVPSSITIPAGSSTGSFEVATVAHSRTLTYTITASHESSSRSVNLTGLGDGISGVVLNPSTVVGGEDATGTVTLIYPAPAFGWTVKLATSSSAYDTLPASITIPAGSSSGTFKVSTAAHGRTLESVITVSDQTTSKQAKLTSLGDAVARLSLLPATVKGGQISGGTVTLLSPAPAFGWTVNISSSGAAVQVPTSITIPAGTTYATFTILTTVAGQGSATITASDQTSTQNQPLVIGSGFWLANSPWPKFRGNLQNQGQGLGHGANSSQKWKFKTNGPVWSSPAIGHDGTIYIGSDDYRLYALTPDGTLKWSFITEGPVRSSPAIGSDETIYVGGGNSLYAINNNGTLKWKYGTGGPIYGSSPTIQSDGTVSIGSSYGFYEISKEGALKYHWPSGNYPITGSPAVWGNNLYAGVLDGVNDLFSYGPGSISWSFPLPLQGSAAVGPDGTIYAGSSTLSPNQMHGIFPTGKSDWIFNVDGAIESGAAVGTNGNVYVASTTALYAFNPHGDLLWSNPVGGSHGSSPSIASDGTIYIGLATGSTNNGMYAFNPNGTLHWKFPTQQLIYSSPAIDSDGTLYFGCLDGTVYAVGTTDTLYTWPNGLTHTLITPGFYALEGDKFQVTGTHNIRVTALGYEKEPRNPQTPLPTGIFDVNGNLLASASISSSDTYSNGYYWQAITPIVLTSGQIYYIGSLHPPGTPGQYYNDSSVAAVPSYILDLNSYYKWTDTLTGGSFTGPGGRTYVGNMKTEIIP